METRAQQEQEVIVKKSNKKPVIITISIFLMLSAIAAIVLFTFQDRTPTIDGFRELYNGEQSTVLLLGEYIKDPTSDGYYKSSYYEDYKIGILPSYNEESKELSIMLLMRNENMENPDIFDDKHIIDTTVINGKEEFTVFYDNGFTDENTAYRTYRFMGVDRTDKVEMVVFNLNNKTVLKIPFDIQYCAKQ